MTVFLDGIYPINNNMQLLDDLRIEKIGCRKGLKPQDEEKKIIVTEM
jgi:hypothetical protein